MLHLGMLVRHGSLQIRILHISETFHIPVSRMVIITYGMESNECSRLFVPGCEYSFDLFNPTLDDIRSVMTQSLCEVEKPRTRLIISMFMNDQRGQHTAACAAFFLGNFTEKVSEPTVIIVKMNGMNLPDKIRVRNHLAP